MATIVLGIVGGVVGGAIGHGNPLAIQKGWAIGTTIGGLIDASNKPSVKSEIGKLTDLRYSGSNYGAAIPKVWGKTMVSGNFIWVANYLNNSTLVPSGTTNSTHLIEHQETSGGGGGGSGGGGGGSVTEYWYSASYAVAFCEASTFEDDDSFSNRNPVIKKIWANDVLIYDVDTPANNNTTIRFHYGSETEMPDTLIEQAEGTGNAPAYRGLVYVVIENHNLKPFGNQLPNIRAEIHTNTVNVGDICKDICGQVNLYGTRIDFSLATALVKGYVVNNRGSAHSLLEPILTAFATDAVEIDGKLKLLPRGGNVVAEIYEGNDEFGAVSEGNIPVVFNKKLGVRSELPGRVDLSYFDVDKNYEQVTQTDIKQSADFNNPVQISLSLTMSATDARQVAARIIDSSYLENDPVTITLSHKYRYLSPGDVLYLDFLQYWWDSGRFRIVKIDETSSENITVVCVKDDPTILTQIITGSSGTGGGNFNNTVPVPCNFYPWSGSELREQDRQNCGFYVAATWPVDGRGGACYYSTDGGTTWIYGSYIGKRTIFGAASTALANGAGFSTWDTTHTLDVNITNDGVSVLQSTTQDGVLNGTNIAVLGNEIIGFVTTQLLSAYSYRLSNLRRGIRKSPYTGHTNTDKFIVVSPALIRISLAETYVGTTVRVKVVAPGQTLADVTHQNVVIAARNPSDIENRLDAIDSPKNANLVYAGPSGGASAQPTFRALVNADLPDMTNNTIKGRSTAGTGDPEDLSGAQVNAILPVFGSTTKGVVPAPNPAGSTRYLREDGTWNVPSSGGGTPGGNSGNIQYNSSGLFAGSDNLTWDNSNGRLGIGTNAPTKTFSISNKLTFDPSVADGSNNVYGVLDTVNAISTSGFKWLSLRSNGTERGYFGWGAGSAFVCGSSGRFDFITGTSFYFTGPNFYLQGTVSMNRIGDATSTATQKNSYAIIFQNSCWTGSASTYRYGIIKSIASNSTNYAHRMAVLLNSSSIDGTGGTELLSCTFDGTVYNVGVGSTAPKTKFEVNGSARTVPVVLTDSSTISLDASLGNNFRVTLGGNRTLGVPTNPFDGQRILIEVIQDGTGSRTLTLSTGTTDSFAFGLDITGITLTSTPNKTDYIGCVYSYSARRWHVIAFVKGY